MKNEINRLKRIHQFIKSNSTGSPKEFSKKLQISESQLYNVLDDLKTKGFPIKYSRNIKSYVYEKYCDLEIHYSIKLLTEDEILVISGGKVKKSHILQCY